MIKNYEQLIARAMRENPSWRYGQVLFNVLYENDPVAADSIRATNIDPFYAVVGDDRLIDFWDWYYSE